MSRRKLDCTKIVCSACCTMEKTEITFIYRQGVLNVPEYNVLAHILPYTTSPAVIFVTMDITSEVCCVRGGTLCSFFRRNVDCGGKDDTETETEETKTDAAVASAGDKDAKNAIDSNVEGKS
jgi:hypothetical protein